MPDVSDPYASLPDDNNEPDHWVLDLPDNNNDEPTHWVLDLPDDFYGDAAYVPLRDQPLHLRPFGVFDEVPGMRTLN